MENSSINKPVVRVSTEIAGRELVFETGRLANQANGALTVTYGESVVLATAVMSPKPLSGIDFFPLTVDYEENYYAAGKVRGSRFVKRKGRPTDDAVLTGRVVDRSIRPFFPDGMRNEVQIIITALSFDRENDPEFMALVGSSAALAISDIPFETVLGGVKIGMVDGNLIVNPKLTENGKNQLDLTVSSTKDGKIAMIEAGAKEIPEEKIKEAIALAEQENRKIIALIEELASKVGKPKREVPLFDLPESIVSFAKKEIKEELNKLVDAYQTKQEFEEKLREHKDAILPSMLEKFATEHAEETFENLQSLMSEAVDKAVKMRIRSLFNEEGRRIDGRAVNQIRPLQIEAGVLPRTHGSAIFARGFTQGLTTATLGSPGSALVLEGMEEELDQKKHYMHFYSFPPFSVGECRPNRGPGRREIGHGALGERALEPVIPSKEDFPYTIVMHTEIMSSDGSTSMASVCGSTLALMDAGVPIKKPVAGIAMGLMYDPEKEKYTVINDLCALEDFSGFMDFKMAGTKEGVTAIQMDIKLKGLPIEVIYQAIDDSKVSRFEILAAMKNVLAESRPNLSPYAPRVISMQIPVDKIRDVIGPGGKKINEIIDQTGVTIDIEQSGLVQISSENEAAIEKAIAIIRGITKKVEEGEEYEGEVVKIMDFGAFVRLTPNQDGMVHISEIKKERIASVRDHLKEGDIVKVKVKKIDPTGRISLTMIF